MKPYLKILIHLYDVKRHITFTWRRHHCRQKAGKFWPFLGAHSLWAERELYRVIPAALRASVYADSSKGPSHLVSLYDKQAVSKFHLMLLHLKLDFDQILFRLAMNATPDLRLCWLTWIHVVISVSVVFYCHYVHDFF